MHTFPSISRLLCNLNIQGEVDSSIVGRVVLHRRFNLVWIVDVDERCPLYAVVPV